MDDENSEEENDDMDRSEENSDDEYHGNPGDLESSNRRVYSMSSGSKRRRDYDNDGSEDENESQSTAITVQGFSPIGLLPGALKKRRRIEQLKRRVCGGTTQGWRCKFCNIGDGKIDGLSNWNMKVIYNMEDDLRHLKRDQFIRTVVDKFNELVVQENIMRNPDELMEEITYDEYELHLHVCYARRNVVETMWSRVKELMAEIDHIRTNGFKYRTQEGRFVLGHKDVSAVVQLERECRQYMLSIDKIEYRNRKEKEKSKAKLNNDMARRGKSYYDK